MQFIDLTAQKARIQDELNERLAQVFDHQRFIMGPEVAELETRLAAYVGVDHCVSASSGTDALQLALMALELGPGDEVITTPFTFVATAEAIRLTGATPVFVDVDVETFNIDPAQVEAHITERTRAVLPVGLFGQTPAMDAINEIAARFRLSVIEDAAQSFGARHGGNASCGLSSLGVTSFFPAKPLGCYGDGGAVFTQDPDLAQRLQALRNHGQERPYHYDRVGMNARLDTVQAAVLLAKLSVFDDEVAARQRVARRYDERLGDIVSVPTLATRCESVFAQYTVKLAERDRVAHELKQADIPTAVYYPVPLNRQLPYLSDDATPNSDYLAARVLSLPMHPYLTESEQDRVCSALRATVV
ncbi:DegT/DnrJ/EryC1/StrS family aminotransferase [Salinisphaera sp. USBA-960]|uniref:DegT/DnrJ/EryC1/StrS family aminotransferase n=1 Tax=Salinisphaera orenii TaxID=856731 RepID=UPI000DBE6688|nr:DegT/DnrJ/EryC1/StrS family aminotransferase [Salifodinibacter halophilus]NNC25319.1 DegT/DnrJ/EryC1/StrS family aminotransferase [Salifodinibacter halophilus]